jgi:hypothetical protein
MQRSALFAFVFLTVLAIGILFQRKRALRKDGWNHLTPGLWAWLGFYGGIVLVCVLNWIIFVAPPKIVGDFHMAFLVTLGAHLLLVVLTYWIAVEEVRWNEAVLERRDLLFRRRVLPWPMLAGFGYYPLLDEYWVSSHAGERIRFRARAGGVDDLIAKILSEINRSGPPAEPAVAEGHPVWAVRSRS